MKKFSELDGKRLYAEDFAWVGNPEEPSTWALRIDDAGHVRDALARWNQEERVPENKRTEVLHKILERAAHFGIDTSNFKKEHHLSAVVFSSPWSAAMLDASAQDKPARIPICKTGTYTYRGEPLKITPEMQAQMAANFNAFGVEIPLTYEHPGNSGDGKARPTAGWLFELDAQPDADGVQWGRARMNPKGADLLRNKEYRFTSASFFLHYPNHRTGQDQGTTLLHVALTHNPFLDMPAIEFSVALPTADQTQQNPASAGKEKTVKVKKVKISPIKEGENKGHLSIQHDDFPKTTDGEETSYMADANEAKKALADAPKLADPDSAGAEELENPEGAEGDKVEAGALRSLILLSGIAGAQRMTKRVCESLRAKVAAGMHSREIVTLSAVPVADGRRDYTALNIPQGALVDGDVLRHLAADLAVDRAIGDGRILPVDRQKWHDLARQDMVTFRAVLPAKALIDLSKRGIGGDGSAAGEVQLSAEEARIAKQLGLDPKKVTESKRKRLEAAQG